MKTKTFITIISACLAFCILMAMMLLVQATNDSSLLNRIGVMLGGAMPGGTNPRHYLLSCFFMAGLK